MGRSAVMQQVFSLIRQVAPSKAAVLVTGESGTGKELVARAIHNLSPRRDGPFVAVNCAAMPETLMESELFGHEKGAFTGALERRAGCFELAQNGTLLLDEIGEMPAATQAKLLRVLEDSRVRRLGGKTEMVVDVRVIASTNKVLDEALRKGQIREDLYYRLNVFRIPLPPLRERMEDLPALVEVLLRDLNKKHGTQGHRPCGRSARAASSATTGRATCASCATRSSGLSSWPAKEPSRSIISRAIWSGRRPGPSRLKMLPASGCGSAPPSTRPRRS